MIGEFEWDHAKAQSNLVKHGVSFEAARLVFDDVSPWNILTLPEILQSHATLRRVWPTVSS